MKLITREELLCPAPDKDHKDSDTCYRVHSYKEKVEDQILCRRFECTKPFEVLVGGEHIKRMSGYCFEHRNEMYHGEIVAVYPFLEMPADRKEPLIRVLPAICDEEVPCKCEKVHVFMLSPTDSVMHTTDSDFYCIAGGCVNRPLAVYRVDDGKYAGQYRALCKVHAKTGKLIYICPWAYLQADQPPSYSSGTGTGYQSQTGYTYSSSSWGSKCTHWRDKIKVGEHEVLVSGRHDRPKDYSDYPEYGIFLDTAWDNDNHACHSPIANLPEEVAKALDITGQRALIINWLDMNSYPLDRLRPVVQWCRDLLADGKKVEIGCLGAHGRTGTFLACLLVEVEGLDPKTAIEEVRERHCKKAVESQKQIDMVYAYAGMEPPKELPQPSKGPATAKDKPKPVLAPNTAFKPKEKLLTEDQSASKNLLKIVRQVLPKKLICPFCEKASRKDKWIFPSAGEQPEALRCPQCKELSVWVPFPDKGGDVDKCPYSDCGKVLVGKFYGLECEPEVDCILCRYCSRLVRMVTEASLLPVATTWDDPDGQMGLYGF